MVASMMFTLASVQKCSPEVTDCVVKCTPIDLEVFASAYGTLVLCIHIGVRWNGLALIRNGKNRYALCTFCAIASVLIKLIVSLAITAVISAKVENALKHTRVAPVPRGSGAAR